ncbi:hypothetical protein KR074_004332 [Drosophila pseudoananassae]|nr:hypothetical protein KR074_004332 [Drosophila pseudoananassae]
MDAAYFLALLLAIFCHMMNLCYNPIEPTKESLLFVTLAMIAFNKINSQDEDEDENTGGVLIKIVEIVILLILVQVLLVVAWFPLSIAVHYIINMVFYYWPGERGWLGKQVQDNAAPLILLALECYALYKGFEMKDIQRFFGSKDDCLSKSVLSMVEKQRDRVMKREMRNQRKGRRTI